MIVTFQGYNGKKEWCSINHYCCCCNGSNDEKCKNTCLAAYRQRH